MKPRLQAKNMKKILMLLTALMAMSVVAVAQNVKLTEVVNLGGHYELSFGLDKNGKEQPLTVDVNGSTVTYSFLGEDFSVVKTIEVKNGFKEDVLDGDNMVVRSPKDMNLAQTFAVYDYYHDPYAVQGLLDDEDEWVVFIRDNDNDVYVLYNEDGREVISLSAKNTWLYLLFFHGKWYVMDWADNKSPIVYTLRSNESAAETALVASSVRSRVYPNPARKSDVLTIELAGPASARTEVELFGVNGSAALKIKVAEGAVSVPFNAGHLSSGTYVYSVNVDGTSVEQGKIIIR